MMYDFLYENLSFLYENLNFLYENLRFSLWKILMILFMIFSTIHEISYYKVRVSTGSVETHWLGGSFLIVYRNNAGRLGSGFISVCLGTRWLGHLGGFYVLERPCKWSMRMPRTSTTTPAGLSLDLYSLKDCPWIQTSTVSPSSQTQPACITWGLATCWRKTWDTWGTFKGRSWEGGTQWVLSRGTTWVWINSRAPDVSSNASTALRRSWGNQVGCGLWMVGHCKFGWELFGDRCIGAWAPSRLSR